MAGEGASFLIYFSLDTEVPLALHCTSDNHNTAASCSHLRHPHSSSHTGTVIQNHHCITGIEIGILKGFLGRAGYECFIFKANGGTMKKFA